MQNILKVIIAILISISLVACASVQIKQELQVGKRTFESGDFKLAFEQLMPLAVKNCAEAQYAVGYMYYYGMGVQRHTQSGLFWIERSTNQLFPPAVKALQVMHDEEKQSKKSFKKNGKLKRPYTKKSLDEVLKDPAIQKKILAQKIDNAAKEKYTLQMFGSHELSKVKELQKKLSLQDKTHIAKTTHKGLDWYILAYGKYPAMVTASLAKDEIPQKVLDLKPWVRKTDSLKFIA